MELTVRVIGDAEYPDLCRLVARAFGNDTTDNQLERIRGLIPRDRTACAFDDGQLVGTCATYPLELAVPGGTTRAAGTTLVTVEATHRRSGVLRAMMRAHLEDVRAREEPLAALWASEGSIYGRFGYGLAAQGHGVELDGPALRFTDIAPPARLRLLDAGSATTELPAIYDRIWRDRPGMLARSEPWWSQRVLADLEEDRAGATALRHVVCDVDGEPAGYATYRQRSSEADFGNGQVVVAELIAGSEAAHSALWRYLSRIDLFPRVSYWNAPADDELEWRLDSGYLVRRRVHDNVWVAPIDPAQALTARSYLDEGAITLEVHDIPLERQSARLRLEVGTDGSVCRRTRRSADLELSAADLGALYMGRRCAGELARAGRLSGSPEAVRTVERLLAWTRAPWCPEVF